MMTRRGGVTLVEVLVAIFIMGIGMIALLTLFPIGILRMAQAIRDERAASAAQNAHAISIAQDIRNAPDVITDGVIPDLFVNPFGAPLPDAEPYLESYPILVDPIGYSNSLAGPPQDWVGGYPGGLRRRPRLLGETPLSIKLSFSLWDDINFENTNIGPALPGTPQQIGATSLVSRDTRFSWAYLLRRPRTSDRSIVDCSIVVFDGRSTAPTGNSTMLAEYVYPSSSYFNPANGTITIDYTNAIAPPLRPGDWILDASFFNPTPTTGSAHGYFYRVVTTEEIVDTTVAPNRSYARYEVQQTLRGFPMPPYTAPVVSTSSGVTLGYQGTAIVISGIVEVFDKGPVRMP